MTTYRYDFSVRGWDQALYWLSNFQIQLGDTERLLFQHIGPLERDFIDVAMAVYVADRNSPRAPGHAGDRSVRMSGRTLQLVIPVRCPEVWRSPEVAARLHAALTFLTADEWEISFVSRQWQRSELIPLMAEDLDRPFVGLFSGGLDSFAGALIQASEPEYRTGVLVSAYSNSSLIHRQRMLIQEMNSRLNRTGTQLRDIHLRHNLQTRVRRPPNGRASTDWQEDVTQRSRGFLFIALGLAVVRVIGLDTLHVYENGVGAINLPHTQSGLGVDYTRAMHPEFIRRMAALGSSVFGSELKIENPSMWKTKGAMCREIADEFGDLAVKTVSCDGFPRHKSSDQEQCGRCTSCLLRRVSLAAADLEQLDRQTANYEHDVYAMVPSVQNESVLFELRCMEHQALRFRRALAYGHPEANLLREFPELLQARAAIAAMEDRSVSGVMGDLIGLVRRYVSDWDWFASFLPRRSGPSSSALEARRE